MSNAAAPVAASDVIEEETQRDPDIALRKLLGRGMPEFRTSFLRAAYELAIHDVYIAHRVAAVSLG